jgi:hypothetical protein
MAQNGGWWRLTVKFVEFWIFEERVVGEGVEIKSDGELDDFLGGENRTGVLKGNLCLQLAHADSWLARFASTSKRV